MSIAESYLLTVSVTRGVEGVTASVPGVQHGRVILRSWRLTEWSRSDEEADGFHGSLFGRSMKGQSTFVNSCHAITKGDNESDFSLFLVCPQSGLYSLHTFERMYCLQVLWGTASLFFEQLHCASFCTFCRLLVQQK